MRLCCALALLIASAISSGVAPGGKSKRMSFWGRFCGGFGPDRFWRFEIMNRSLPPADGHAPQPLIEPAARAGAVAVIGRARRLELPGPVRAARHGLALEQRRVDRLRRHPWREPPPGSALTVGEHAEGRARESYRATAGTEAAVITRARPCGRGASGRSWTCAPGRCMSPSVPKFFECAYCCAYGASLGLEVALNALFLLVGGTGIEPVAPAV